MRDVYSGAICCIAATAAKDGDIGLFFDRDLQGLFPTQVGTSKARIQGQNTSEPLVAYTIRSKVVSARMAIDSAPLNQRAWVAQERYLSTGIIHFTQELIFWECQESLKSEQDPDGRIIAELSLFYPGDSAIHTLRSRIHDYRDQLNSTRCVSTNINAAEIFSKIHKDWCSFREVYSSLGLTKQEDIFVALNGIARAVAEVTNDTLVAGLWRGRLIEDLCWRRNTIELVHPIDAPPRPSVWRAPTWSWASINRVIESHKSWWERSSFVNAVNDMAVIKQINADHRPSGALIHACLAIKCRLIPIFPLESDVRGWAPYKVTVTLDDCTITNAKDLGNEISLVVLRHFAHGEGGGVQGILVSPSRVKTGSYERLGYFEFTAHVEPPEEEKRIVQSVLEGYNIAQETTIELI